MLVPSFILAALPSIIETTLIQGFLGGARINLQVDVGFGDEIVPEPYRILYPALLDFPAPALKGYTMESTIAE